MLCACRPSAQNPRSQRKADETGRTRRRKSNATTPSEPTLTAFDTERRILACSADPISTCPSRESHIATYRHTFATEAEAKAFFQGVTSVSNVLVNVESVKVEAVGPTLEGELWSVYVIVGGTEES
jgi:hypothetical protein